MCLNRGTRSTDCLCPTMATASGWFLAPRPGVQSPDPKQRDRAMKLSYELICDEFAAVGEPAECVAKLEELREVYDAQEFMCWFNTGGAVPQEEVEKSMELFADKVMPHFR